MTVNSCFVLPCPLSFWATTDRLLAPGVNDFWGVQHHPPVLSAVITPLAPSGKIEAVILASGSLLPHIIGRSGVSPFSVNDETVRIICLPLPIGSGSVIVGVTARCGSGVLVGVSTADEDEAGQLSPQSAARFRSSVE